MLSSWPRAILHVDADAFFTSVEQALDPSLKGRPLATGRERGIIACASYEAKARGVARGIPLFAAQKLCPDLLLLASDYESYSLYSKRMFNIIRNYTPIVEEYSIDEAFADISGMRRVFRCSYEEIARRIQEDIRRELDITVSVGMSLSKSLAKIGSKFRKPRGFTPISGPHIHLLLQRTPLEKVWGFGPNTVTLLKKHGLLTAWDFVSRPEKWAARILHKPGREIWNELRGNQVWPISPEEKSTYATIMKSKTFTPPSGDSAQVYARLILNLESALMKARRHRLRPRSLAIVLRHHDFHHDGLEARLNRPTASTMEVIPLVRQMFDHVFRQGSQYRSTMVILGGLESDASEQLDLFEDRLRIDKLQALTRAMDEINGRFGKHKLGAGTSLDLAAKPHSARDEPPMRSRRLLTGETSRRRLAIPRMDIKV